MTQTAIQRKPIKRKQRDRGGRGSRGIGSVISAEVGLLVGAFLITGGLGLAWYTSPGQQYWRQQKEALVKATADHELTQAIIDQDAAIEEAKAAAEAEEANRRYASACLMLSDANLKEGQYRNQAIAIAHGVVYYDSESVQGDGSKAPLPEGKIVCDDRGTTAKIGWVQLYDDQGKPTVKVLAATDIKNSDNEGDIINIRFEQSFGWLKYPKRSSVTNQGS